MKNSRLPKLGKHKVIGFLLVFFMAFNYIQPLAAIYLDYSINKDVGVGEYPEYYCPECLAEGYPDCIHKKEDQCEHDENGYEYCKDKDEEELGEDVGEESEIGSDDDSSGSDLVMPPMVSTDLPMVLPVPASGGFSTTVSRAALGDGGLQTPFTNTGVQGWQADAVLSRDNSDAMRINLNVPFEVASTNRYIEIEFGFGMTLQSAPGMVFNNATGGFDFNPSTLTAPDNSFILSGQWVPTGTEIPQASGNNHTPRSGILRYEIATTYTMGDYSGADITNVNFPVLGITDWNLIFKARYGGSARPRYHIDPIMVRTNEDTLVGAIGHNSVLNYISLLGDIIITPTRTNSTYGPVTDGDTWHSQIELTPRSGSHSIQSASIPTLGNPLTESISFEIRVPTVLTARDDIVVVATPAGSGVAFRTNNPLLLNALPNHGVEYYVHPNTINVSGRAYWVVSITLSQARLMAANGTTRASVRVSGVIPTGTPPGTYQHATRGNNPVTNQHLAFHPSQRYNIVTPADHNRTDIIVQTVGGIPRPTLHPLMNDWPTSNQNPINQRLARFPSAAPLSPLGGFVLTNTALAPEQALFLDFTAGLPYMGVRAVRIPTGNGGPNHQNSPIGLYNLSITTTHGRELHFEGNEMLPLLGTTGSIGSGSGNPRWRNINFYHHLYEDEFIITLRAEMRGYIGVIVQAVPNADIFLTPGSVTFLYFGVLHNTLPVNHDIRSSGIVGWVCPNGVTNENPSGTREGSTWRDYATTTMRTSGHHAGLNGNSGWGFNVSSPGLPATQGPNAQRESLPAGFSRYATEGNMLSIQFNRHNTFLGTPNVAAMQGFYLYLRCLTVEGIIEVVHEDTVITWGSHTWEFNDLPRTRLYDTLGNRVYRLHLYDVILGQFDENLNMFPPVRIDFDVRALPTTDTRTVDLQELIFITTIADTSRVFQSGNANGFGSHDRTHHMMLGRRPTPPSPVGTAPGGFHPEQQAWWVVDCDRAGQDRWVGSPRVDADWFALNLLGETQINTWTDIRTINEYGETIVSWTSYDWATNSQLLHLIPDATVHHRFTYRNQLNVPLNNFAGLIPIPKRNELLPQRLANDVPNQRFGFTLNLIRNPALDYPADYTFRFSHQHTLDRFCTSFMTWEDFYYDNGFPFGTEDIRMVLISSNGQILPGAYGSVVLHLEPLHWHDMVNFTGTYNRYAALVTHIPAETVVTGVSRPVAMRSWQMVRFQPGVVPLSLVEDMPENIWAAPLSVFLIEDIVPTAPGFTFVEWRMQHTGNFYDPDDYFEMPWQDVVLVAQWQPIPGIPPNHPPGNPQPPNNPPDWGSSEPEYVWEWPGGGTSTITRSNLPAVGVEYESNYLPPNTNSYSNPDLSHDFIEFTVISANALPPEEDDEIEDDEEGGVEQQDYSENEETPVIIVTTSYHMPQTGISDSRTFLATMLAITLSSVAFFGRLIRREKSKAKLIRK
ncbi:MAG: hypothetical protein FWE21_00665 [Defluviitaleaceae bacterium]|nr:hypothetical protein [Defluviitaleaceae bacterium]